MKNKIVFGIMIGWIILSAIMIWGVGGSAAPYFWNAAIMVVAPVAIFGALAALICLIRGVCKRRNVTWNVIFFLLCVILVVPGTTVFGKGLLTYPDKETDVMEMKEPVKNGVYKGGKEYKSHAFWPSERYAYDIVCEPYSTKSKNLTDYGIYGAKVYAPVSGTVIGMKDGEEDIEPNVENFTSTLGNYIFLKIDDSDSYLILAHLQKGSVAVKNGEHVESGEMLAKVGNSGTTSEPHLHIQRQRNNPLKVKFAICAQGLPMKFHS